jgi:hypothetical protein
MNDIPYLEIKSDVGDKSELATFTNGMLYHFSAEDEENISAMMKGEYTLTAAGDEATSILEIKDPVLNEPFMKATHQLNILLEKVRILLGSRDKRKRGFVFNKPSLTSFTLINEPTESKMVWANIADPSGERHCCAVSCKIGNRVVYREDVTRAMNNALSELHNTVARLERQLSEFSIRRITDEASRLQESQVTNMTGMLITVKNLMDEASEKRTELQMVQRKYPEDPIARVIRHSSLTQTTGQKPEWQSYQTQLAKNRDKLIVKSKKFKVDTITTLEERVLNVTFVGSSLAMTLEPLILNAGLEIFVMTREHPLGNTPQAQHPLT